jgi:hypothetical protein
MMAFVVGAVMALAVGLFGRAVGLDRERAFYATTLAVIALLYDLFAVMGNSMTALLLDSLIGAIFMAAVVLGFRRNEWIIVLGLFGHGLMDLFHARLVANPGVPEFWPMFCSAYDVTAAAFLAVILRTRPRPN